MNKYEKMFERLFLKFEEEGYKKATDNMKVAYSLQNKNKNKMINELANILFKNPTIVKDNKTYLDLSLNQQKTLYKKLAEQLVDDFQKEGKTEVELTKETLQNIIKEKYNHNAYLFSIGGSFKLNKLNRKQINAIVNAKTQGINWSDRVWTNKKELEKILRKEIKLFLNGNTNIDNAYKIIKKRYNQNAYNTHRLVNTEVARCQASTNEKFYSVHGVEQVIYLATLDNHTCHECALTDGNVYDLNESRPELPRHPLDRCTYKPIPFEGWKPKVRIDNTTKEYVPFVSYKEWSK